MDPAAADFVAHETLAAEREAAFEAEDVPTPDRVTLDEADVPF